MRMGLELGLLDFKSITKVAWKCCLLNRRHHMKEFYQWTQSVPN